MDYINLFKSIETIGLLVVALGGFTGAMVQIRSWINSPFDKLMLEIDSVKKTIEADKSKTASDITKLDRAIQSLSVHFDPDGGNIRDKIARIEARLAGLEAKVAAIETLGSSERTELRSMLAELKPIIASLKE